MIREENEKEYLNRQRLNEELRESVARGQAVRDLRIANSFKNCKYDLETQFKLKC